MAFTEDITEFFDVDEGFAELADVTRAGDEDIAGATVIVDRGVEIVTDGGMAVTTGDTITFIRSQLVSGANQILLDAGDVVTLTASGDTFTLNHVITQDSELVVWHVR